MNLRRPQIEFFVFGIGFICLQESQLLEEYVVRPHVLWDVVSVAAWSFSY